MLYETIISAQDLADNLDNPKWVILDARFNIDSEDEAKLSFPSEHIVGAQQADLADHMAGEIIPGKSGRRPLPPLDQFEQTIRSWGIDNDSQVVVYDSMNGIMAAARLWVLLNWAGHTKVALLDGGYQAWQAAGLPVDSAVKVPPTGTFTANFRPELIAELAEVEAATEDPSVLLFDSRSLSDGIPSHDAIRGRIPSSGAADRALNSTSDGKWRTSEELKAHYDDVIGQAAPEQVIFYCGSGVTAAQNLVGMAHAGFRGAKMYPGSWSQWILDPERQIQEY